METPYSSIAISENTQAAKLMQAIIMSFPFIFGAIERREP